MRYILHIACTLVLGLALAPRGWAKELGEPEYQAWRQTVGRRLKESMRARGMRQRELAPLLGIRQSRVSKIVSGSQTISLAQAQSAARLLEVDPDWLLGLDLIRVPDAKGPDANSAPTGRPTTFATDGRRSHLVEIVRYAATAPNTRPSARPSSCSGQFR